MMTRGRSPEYARERVAVHAGRVHALCDSTERQPDGDGAALDATLDAALGDRVPPDASALVAALDPPRAG